MKKYGVIYADPPWSYRNKTIRGGAANHYSTMPIDDLCKLPIDRITEDDCALFLWATQPTITDALKLMDAWGFRYVNFAFTWVKLVQRWRERAGDPSFVRECPADISSETFLAPLFFMGTGFYTRGNPEVCLLGVRGRFTPQDRGVRQLVVSPVGNHSSKPDEVRSRIDKLVGPEVRRIELFARAKHDGWDAWGDEVNTGDDWAQKTDDS